MGKSLRISTCGYAGQIQDAFRVCDTYLLLTSVLSEFIFGNGNVALATRIRKDNSVVVEHVHSINSVTKERRLDGLLESREDPETDPWLALSKTAAPLNISAEMAKSRTRNKLFLLMSRNISQSMSGNVKDEIREIYPADMQYLAFRATKGGRWDLDTFARRRAGVGSWEMVNRFALF